MILETLLRLNQKNGSSLSAIRKSILSHYNIKKTSKISFNNLTLRAINSNLLENKIIKNKNSYMLNIQEKKNMIKSINNPPNIHYPAEKGSKAKSVSLHLFLFVNKFSLCDSFIFILFLEI